MYWVNESVFYHIYPLGFTGAPRINDGKLEYRLDKVLDFIPHFKEMNVNAIYFGPVFSSTTHGYDTNDYYNIDNRLGDNESFARICKTLHENGIKVVLDGVFNHVGRGFWAFEDVRRNLQSSPYCSWFRNLNFGGNSPWGDPFWYEGWEGNYDLVKLELRHPDVKKHIFDAVAMWMDKFGIDGLRLDVAYCMDQDFLRELKHFCKSRNSSFWLMGEIIHGDYARLANPDLLDSCTNYECYKGIYSSHNDHNYFEIAHSLNRQFANGGIYHNIYTYNFVDNHDVNRLASTIREPENLKNCFSTLYFMPGVPSVYYGSEWGIKGQKNRTEHDYPLRPCVNVSDIEKNELFRHICRLGAVRRKYKALKYGSFMNIVIKNEQLVFRRRFEDETVYIALNLSDEDYSLGFNTEGGSRLFDVFDGRTVYDVKGGHAEISIPARGTRVLVLTDGEAPEYPEGDETSPAEATNEVPEMTDSVCEERKPLPPTGAPGRYRHFKGGEYEFICLAKDSETSEELVIYKALYGDGGIWARPSAIFYQYVNVDGKEVPRFEKID